jgi:hypothetical protein
MFFERSRNGRLPCSSVILLCKWKRFLEIKLSTVLTRITRSLKNTINGVDHLPVPICAFLWLFKSNLWQKSKWIKITYRSNLTTYVRECLSQICHILEVYDASHNLRTKPDKLVQVLLTRTIRIPKSESGKTQEGIFSFNESG